MSQFPSMPLFVDAYLADTGHLTEAEHGRYLLMLMALWRAPGCRIPNDDEWLARRFRCTAEEVQLHLRPIIAEYMDTDTKWITNRRLFKEWKWVRGKRRKNADAAKSRWNHKKDPCERNATQQCERNAPNPNPNPIEERTKTGARAPRSPRAAGGLRPLPTDWAPSEAHLALGRELGVDVRAAAEAMREWAAAENKRGHDWDARFRLWLRRERPSRGPGPRANGGGKAISPNAQRWRDAMEVLNDAARTDRTQRSQGTDSAIAGLLPPSEGRDP